MVTGTIQDAGESVASAEVITRKFRYYYSAVFPLGSRYHAEHFFIWFGHPVPFPGQFFNVLQIIFKAVSFFCQEGVFLFKFLNMLLDGMLFPLEQIELIESVIAEHEHQYQDHRCAQTYQPP